MTNPPDGALRETLTALPATQAIVATVLDEWPEHLGFLTKSFAARTDAQLDATEEAAAATLKLIGDDPARFARGYRWTCDQLRDEELFFHREGRYRLATFAEADAEVYSNHEYMTKYVDGLLLTQVLWYNHVATFEMFLRVLREETEPFSYLEVGPGHGLMIHFAARAEHCERLEAWDVSPVSLRETRAALDRLDTTRPITLTEVDILKAERPEQRYDLIVISEVLEHLEQPQAALDFLAGVLAPGGRIYVNVPLNSPSPDHIYLLRSPEAAAALAENAGLRVERSELYATQGQPLAKALAQQITVSVGMVAEVGPSRLASSGCARGG